MELDALNGLMLVFVSLIVVFTVVIPTLKNLVVSFVYWFVVITVLAVVFVYLERWF